MVGLFLFLLSPLSSTLHNDMPLAFFIKLCYNITMVQQVMIIVLEAIL